MRKNNGILFLCLFILYIFLPTGAYSQDSFSLTGRCGYSLVSRFRFFEGR